MKNIKKIAEEILHQQDYSDIIAKIKKDLNKVYDKLNIGLRFNSSAFNIYDKDGKIFFDIPIYSTTRNETFIENLTNKSIETIIKNLKKIIIVSKKDFIYEGKMSGPFSGSIYSIKK